MDPSWTREAERNRADTRPHTDLGNAERFAERYSDRVRYCWPTGKWLCWDGTRWKHDDAGTATRLGGEIARAMLRDAASLQDEDARRNLVKWALQCESAARIAAMLQLAKSQTPITILPAQLDTDPWLLNTPSGSIDLRTGELRPHRPADFCTKITASAYDHDAECPIWDAFLNRIFDNHQPLIQWVMRFLGHALTGVVTEQILPVLHGEGGNGKSVLLDTVAAIMGEYAAEAPPQLITESKNSEHPTEIADLMGRRFVIASETEDNTALKIQLVKRLTGNATLKARYMRQDYFEFPRTHKLALVTNNKPRVRENSEAVWRRLRLVPFKVVIPVLERDKNFIDKLKPEHPAILAKLVEHCLHWQRSGLGDCDDITQATDSYRAAEDRIGTFIEECCETDQAVGGTRLFAPWSALMDAYTRWGERSGEHTLGARRFGDALDKRGFASETRRIGYSTSKVRLGLAIKASENGQIH